MANLTAYPDMKVLKVEVSHGLQVDRSSNGNIEDYDVTETTLLGQKCTYYVPKGDQSDVIDGFAYGRKPYCVAITCAIESPMKLFVQNQNYSKILLGSDNMEPAKNIVRFETNLAWTDLADILPTIQKKPHPWIITDYNNLMNENPYFH